MSEIFKGASSFNGDISRWDVSKAENMSYMFSDASAFNQDLEDWKDHWTLSNGKYTGSQINTFTGSGIFVYRWPTPQTNYPSWHYH